MSVVASPFDLTRAVKCLLIEDRHRWHQPLGFETVRTVAALLLIGLVMFCPVLCGAVEVAHGPHRHADGAPGDSRAPEPCPEQGDNCICQGAVPSVDARLPGLLDVLGSPHFLLGGPTTLPQHLACPVDTSGALHGLASWGDSVTVRAYLQNFRC